MSRTVLLFLINTLAATDGVKQILNAKPIRE
jgi:hypothetical protein